MSHSKATLLYREPRLLALLLGMIITLGLAAYLTIGKQEDPTITNLFATIVTPYPGADPERVEALVSKKLEDELKEIPEIIKIVSNSRTGISVLLVELSQFINDQEIEQAWAEIRDKIEDARRQMPLQVGPTSFDNNRVGAFTMISAISATDGYGVSPALLSRYAGQLQDRLRQVSGSSDVELFGDTQEVVYVKVDPIRLNALGITINDVATSIRLADVKSSAGRAETAQSSLVIELAGEAKNISRLKAIPIRSDAEQQLLLGDIASFEKTLRDPAGAIGFSKDKQSVMVAARMKSDLRVDDWTERSMAAIAEFEANLPVDISHEIIFSQAAYTSDRLTEVAQNMLVGVTLVIAVLFFTMGWRSAMVVAIVLPLTAMLSLSILQFLAIPIHQMSVTGLIVALGLLVDAAIVMTDDIGRKLAGGQAKIEALAAAIKRLRWPLFASTVTTALAFMPMALLPGPAGDFVGSIATSVIIMLVSSFLLALTVTPTLAGWFLNDHAVQKSHFPGLVGVFEKSLEWSMRKPALSIALSLILPVTGFLLFPTLTAQFFPGVDRDQFYIQVDLGNGASIKQTQAKVQSISKLLEDNKDILQQHWIIGENAPPFYYNMQRNRDSDPSFAEGLVTTRTAAATERLIPELQLLLDREIPEAQILVRGLLQGPPVNAPVEIKIFGPDLNQLTQLGDEVRERMSRVSDVTHTRHSLNAGAPKFVFELDENKVQRSGYQLVEIANLMSASVTGLRAGSIVEQTEELPIIVRLNDAFRTDIEWFRHLMLPSRGKLTNQASLIPLSSFGEPVLTPSQNVVVRENGERINTVQGFIKRGLLPEEVLKQVQTTLADDPVNLPPGYRFEIGGDADARDQTVSNLMSSMGLIVTLSIATIVLTFRSYRLSIIAFTVCFLSAGLSILSLAIMNYPFGITALIGVIGSIGVSINAAIIIMTALQENEAAMTGSSEAIKETVFKSSRHIVSTTTTTFGGFLPLILAGGGFWPPFAMSIAGGVLLSTIVSFYFTPPMFKVWYLHKQHKSEVKNLSIETTTS